MTEQRADAVGVGDDVTYVRDGGESGIGGNESISPGRMRRGGQDRIERPGTSAVLEQPQAFTRSGSSTTSSGDSSSM